MTVACYYTVEIRAFFHMVYSVVSSTLMSSSMVIVEFGWNNHFDDALANASTILWISSAEWAISALFSHKYMCGFVFALKCATVKRSAFWRDWM